MKKLAWETKQVKVEDLIPLDFNPRTISEEKRDKLIKSLEKFNLAEIPAVNTDLKIIGGNQRVFALMICGRGEELIDVRMPNRHLTEREVKEYAIISNTHAGEWDVLKLDEFFSDLDLVGMGVELPEMGEGIDEISDLGDSADPFDDEGISAKNQYAVIVLADDEINQQEIFEKLSSMGYKLKIAVV